MTHDEPLPLFELGQHSWIERCVASFACHVLLGCVALALPLVTCLGWLRGLKRDPEAARIVLTGMFKSDGWLEAHVRPLALSERCQHVWVVTDKPMLELPKTTYVCPPAWMQRAFGLIPARALYCFITTLRVRPHVVGGFHLTLNGLVALLAARLAGGKSLYFCVGGWCELWGGGARSENRLFGRLGRDNPRLERLMFHLVKKFDLVLTMGSRARSYLVEHGVSAPVEIMSGGIDQTRFYPSNGEVKHEYDAIFVGRLVRVKRLDVLLDAVAIAKRSRPELLVALVGDGPLREELGEQARRLGIERTVAFVGHQTDVAGWLRKARVFVISSDTEGLALSLMEAGMSGLPSVVTNVGDLADLIEDGRNGWLVPRRDADAMSGKLIELLGDEELSRQYSTNARAAAMEYSVESTSAKWSGLLADVLLERESAS